MVPGRNSEKALILPLSSGKRGASSRRARSRPAGSHFVLGIPAVLLLLAFAQRYFSQPAASLELCKQFPAVHPAPHAADANREVIFSAEYRRKSAGILSGLVQIPSESYDDNGPVSGENRDPRWDTFNAIPPYLAEAFPLVHSTLHLEMVNIHAPLYTWNGSNPDLKPMMLMAHLDVVGVDPATVSSWTHPPYSGFYDGKYLWGRGSVDCKDTVSAILESLEFLIGAGWIPTRSIILAFGFDEESAGSNGAGALATYLEETIGSDSVAFIVDEGGGGVGEVLGTAMALPGTAEKGYIDVEISLHAPGGHSSIPPDHTSIGILSSLISTLEAHPYSPSLSETSPVLSLLQCAATHGELNPTLKSHVLEASRPGKKGAKGRQRLAEAYAATGKEAKYLVQTSQAIDVFNGGVKVNALPEVASFTGNYRIAIDSSPKFVKDRITAHLVTLASKHNLELDAFGVHFNVSEPSYGVLKAVGIGELEAAPISLTTSKPWALLASTIQHAFANRFPQGLVVAPGMDTGNTDTHMYWGLTRDIYRFTPANPSSNEFIHTVNEHLDFDEHLQAIWFFHELIRNGDAADL